MICWDRVHELKEEVGEDDFAEIVSLFLAETEDALGRLGATTDPEEAEALLHSLKGSALNLGFEEMSRLCREGRGAAAGGPGWEAEFARIAKAFEDSRSKLFASG